MSDVQNINNKIEPINNTDSSNSFSKNKIAHNNNIEHGFSVSKYIDTEFRIVIKAGNKGTCPFCSHKTFSVKKDDTLGKCFHPDCAKVINICSAKGYTDYKQEILQKLFDDWHLELLNLKNISHYDTAYKYLLDRNINQEVINDSMLGAIPSNYDIEEIFKKNIDKLNNEIGRLEKKIKQFGNPESKHSKDLEYKKNTLLKKLNDIEPLKEKLRFFLMHKAGDLVFFYTDKYHRITRIKTRKPYKKNFATCTFNEDIIGVFNHQLFNYSRDDKTKNPIMDNIIVVEGEFNQLQLQSLIVNNGNTYINSCAIGGVLNADFQSLKEISKNWYICYDNDLEQTGFELVKNAQNHHTFYVFTTPKTDSDLDSFIKEFKTDYHRAFLEFQSILGTKQKYYRNLNSVKEKINSIRNNHSKLKLHILSQKVSDFIINELSLRAEFYYNSNYNYLFLEEINKLIQINIDSEDIKILLSEMGINPSEQIYKFVYEDIVKHCKKQGKKAIIHNFCHYDSKQFALYLYNNEDKVFKITKDEILSVKNGHDNVLFLYNNSFTPFELVEPIDKTKDYFNDLIVSEINLSDINIDVNSQKKLLNYWFLSIFFKSIMKSKPIMTMIGVKGSGKTTYLRIIGKIIFGENFDVTPLPSDEKIFDTIISNSSYVVFDNVDNHTKWLNDKLACVATGQVIKTRELYTTNKMAEFKADSYVCLTSRTPQFTRDDVADRLLLCYLTRIEEYKSENEIIEEVLKNRNLIMTSTVHKIQKAIKALYENRNNSLKTNFRIADFGIFCMKYAKTNENENEIIEVLNKYSQSQSNLAIEDDPLIECLKVWLDFDNGHNEYREIDSRALYSALSDIAFNSHIKDFKYQSPVSIGKRLNNIKDNLKGILNIEIKKGSRNKTFYKFNYVNNEEKTKLENKQITLIQ